MDNATPDERFLRLSQIAARWGCSKAKVYRMSREAAGFPVVHRLGARGTRVRLSDLVAFEAAQAVPAKPLVP